ncbi:ABC transporter ATP-binding protein/permease [Streptomyces sp. 372A]
MTSTLDTPENDKALVAGRATVLRAACDLIRQDRLAFVAMLLFNALAVGAGLVGPWVIGEIINRVQKGTTAETVDRLALLLIVTAVVQFLLVRLARYVGFRFGERTLARVREQFVDRVLALPLSTVEEAGTGDLSVRGTTDVNTVGMALRDAGPDVFVAAVQVPLILGAVFLVSPLLGVSGVVGLAGIGVAVRWYLRRAHTAYLAEGEANSALAEQLAAAAAGARTIEAFRLEDRHIAQSLEAIETCYRTRTRTLHLRSVLFPAVDISYVIPVASVLLVGGVLHNHGLVSIGALVASALYFRQLSQPLDTLLQWLELLQSSGASFARVEGVRPAPGTDKPADTEGGVGQPAGHGIELDHVHFSYDGVTDVVRDVSLTVRSGERLVVVGPSGAGKTTLSRLIAGTDKPHRGSVLVGGVPVAAVPPETLRRQMVLVTQEHHVFLGTVRDNLSIAAPTATDEELMRALSAVGADWAERLPRGLDTRLGTQRNRLNGAQAQQLGLARVLLANPHTLILDEATALLDPRTARRAERTLATVLEGRTVIAVAHRLHTAHDADRVAVLEGGRLTELGSHDDLVSAGGTYAGLWRSWHGSST